MHPKVLFVVACSPSTERANKFSIHPEAFAAPAAASSPPAFAASVAGVRTAEQASFPSGACAAEGDRSEELAAVEEAHSG